jgi:hypothetical protein
MQDISFSMPVGRLKEEGFEDTHQNSNHAKGNTECIVCSFVGKGACFQAIRVVVQEVEQRQIVKLQWIPQETSDQPPCLFKTSQYAEGSVQINTIYPL